MIPTSLNQLEFLSNEWWREFKRVMENHPDKGGILHDKQGKLQNDLHYRLDGLYPGLGGWKDFRYSILKRKRIIKYLTEKELNELKQILPNHVKGNI